MIQPPEDMLDANGNFPVKRSGLDLNWQSAPKDLIIDDARMAILASGYQLYPRRQYGGKITMEQRIRSALSAPVVVIDDIPIPLEPIEPRQYFVGDKWDARYKHPVPMLRSKLPPHWPDARTSLIIGFVRTLQLAMSFEQFPSPDISWLSRRTYAYGTPVELYDDVWSGSRKAYDLYHDSLLKKEQRLALKWNIEKIGALFEIGREQSRKQSELN